MSDLVMTTGRYNTLPTYDGTRDVNRLNEYLRIIPTYFDKNDTTQQRNVLIRSLRGAAGNWLESCMRHEDWEKYNGELLLAGLKTKYYPQNQEEHNANKLIQLKQGSNTLSEYLRKFDEIGLNVSETILSNPLRKYYLVYNLNEPLRSSDAFHSRDLQASLSYLEDLCNREEPPSRKSLLPKPSFGPDNMEIDHLAPTEYPPGTNSSRSIHSASRTSCLTASLNSFSALCLVFFLYALSEVPQSSDRSPSLVPLIKMSRSYHDHLPIAFSEGPLLRAP